jgi:hypothetical protein
MPPRQSRSRVHLLVAKQAPKIVILQRKRSKLFHVARIDVRTHRIEHGSWFRGKLYPFRCDVSFDGEYMVYLALGGRAQTWNGVCKLPWLTTVTEAENMGTWFGGGYFRSRSVLRTNGWGGTDFLSAKNHRSPFKLEPYRSQHGGEDLGVVYERLLRDGFRRLGDAWGDDHRLATRTLRLAREGDDGWGRQFSPRHPELKVRYAGYLEHGYTFTFWFDAYPLLLDGASWANWDAYGALWVARPGVVEQYLLDDLRHGEASFSVDVDEFEPRESPAV